MDKNDFLVNLPIWNRLNSTEQELVRNGSYIGSMEKGRMMHNYSTECLGLIQVISGEIRTFMLSEEGREITIGQIFEGDICPLCASGVISQITFDTYIITEESTDLLVVRPEIIRILMESNIYVKSYMHELISSIFSKAMFFMEQILFYRMDQRLAIFLIEECERKNTREIRYTHNEIAIKINSAREVVTKMLKSFADDTLITLKRGIVYVNSIDGLKNYI